MSTPLMKYCAYLALIFFLFGCSQVAQLPVQPTEKNGLNKSSGVTITKNSKNVLGIDPIAMDKLNEEIFKAAEKQMPVDLQKSAKPEELVESVVGILDEGRTLTKCTVRYQINGDIAICEFFQAGGEWKRGLVKNKSKNQIESHTDILGDNTTPYICNTYNAISNHPVYRFYQNEFLPSGYWVASVDVGDINRRTWKAEFVGGHYSKNDGTTCWVNDLLWQSKICYDISGAQLDVGRWQAIPLWPTEPGPCILIEKTTCDPTITDCDTWCGLNYENHQGSRYVRCDYRILAQIGDPQPIIPTCSVTPSAGYLLWDDIPGATSYDVYEGNIYQTTVTAVPGSSYAYWFTCSSCQCGGTEHIHRIDMNWQCTSALSPTTITGVPVGYRQ